MIFDFRNIVSISKILKLFNMSHDYGQFDLLAVNLRCDLKDYDW